MILSPNLRRATVTALSAVAVVAVLAGCASPGSDSSVASGVSSSPVPTAASAAPAPPIAEQPAVRSAALDASVAGDTSPPVRVEVPAKDIDLPVLPTGVKADGEMEIPANPAEAGWYRWGPGPADGGGSTVIAAHVDSLAYGLGPFAELRDLPTGESITVITADGGSHRYVVESVVYYPKDQLPTEAIFDRSGPARLSLVTCGGSFDEISRTYSDNVVVTAVPAP